MQPQHTPGPWTANPDGVIIGADETRIARVNKGEGAHADIRLIAAAPDMLAALRRLHALLFLYTDQYNTEAMNALLESSALIDRINGAS